MCRALSRSRIAKLREAFTHLLAIESPPRMSDQQESMIEPLDEPVDHVRGSTLDRKGSI
jgi:hypothetical protein